MDKELTQQEKIFIYEYITVRPLNPEKAALRAGYAPSTARSKSYLWVSNKKQCPKNKHHVLEAINEALKRLAQKYGVTAEQVFEEQTKLGFSRMDNHVTVDEAGFVRAKSFEEMPEEAIAAIKTVEEKRRVISTPAGDQILESTFKFALHDKVAILRDMGKALGMYTDKVEHSGELELKGLEVRFVKPSE